MNKLYFAFGSNMLQARLEARVGPVRRVGVHSISGWRLIFNAGRGAQCFANIEMIREMDKKDTHFVIGVIYELSERQLRMLDQFEGAPWLYTRVTIKSFGLNDIQAYVAINPNYVHTTPVFPEKSYVQLMIEGAISNGIKGLPEYLSTEILPTAIERAPLFRKKRKAKLKRSKK